MAVPYSTQFAAGAFTGPGSVVLYTAPAGNVTVLRDIELVNSSNVASEVEVELTAIAIFYQVQLAALTGWSQWKGRTVFNVGQSITLAVPSAAQISYFLSGYLLRA